MPNPDAIEAVLAAFNGGLVSKANPKAISGTTVYYKPREAMLAALTAAEPFIRAEALEDAWRDGFQSARECLTDDEAFCLTEDVERDAWADSKTAAIRALPAKGDGADERGEG